MNTIFNQYTETIKELLSDYEDNYYQASKDLGYSFEKLMLILENSNNVTIHDRIELYNLITKKDNHDLYNHKFEDERGYHIKYFVNDFDFKIDEVFATHSKKNVIRGFHTSIIQTKIIKVLNGSIEFIAVNTKNKSIKMLELDNSDKALVIEPGTWIGYRVLEDDTVVSYLCNGGFTPGFDLSASPSSFSNEYWLWNLSEDEAIISEKDASSPKLNI